MDELRRIAKALGRLVGGRPDITPRQLYVRALVTASSGTCACLAFGLNPETAFLGLIGLNALVVLATALAYRN